MIASDKSSKNRHKAAANNKKTAKPSFAEMNALITMFNKGRLADSEQLATKMTEHFAQDGFGWKILGAIRQQQGLIEPAFEALKIAAILLPNDSEAHYNLGNSFYDKSQLEDAANSYKKSIEIDPRFAQAHYNLGSVLNDQGLFADAESCYKVALEINPDNAEMHFNLALMLYEKERFSEAANYYQQALKIQPDFTAAHVNLGASLKALGKLREAESSYRKALIIKPDHADAYNNLGVVLKDLGDIADAESCYRKAISINLNYASAYNNLGILLKDTGQTAEAESCYMKALKIDPLRAVSHNNLAVLFREQGRLADSEVCCRNALKIKPNYADAFNNLGLALDSQGRLPEAEAAFEQALELEPNSVSVLSNFSVTLNTLSQLTRAEVYLLKALDLAPQFINAHINLCVNYLAQGRIQEAEDICTIALQIQPDCMGAQNNLLFSMNYSADYSAADCLEKARQYGLMVASKVDIPFTSWQHNPHTKRLRVGLVSGDLRQHVVAYFLENLIQYIDSSSIELIAYPTTNREDEVTARLKPHFSGWKSLVGLTDQAAAQLIHNDGLHILMDLSGHSAGNRLPIFAWKPAPLQVSWLGYFATTGMAAMDYFIADVVGVPELQQSQFVEKIKYLPETRLCFTAPEADIAVSPLPAFANKFITFGCFQNMAKVGDDVLDLWAEIMVALPNAKLRWQCKSFRDNLVAEELKQRLLKRGVDSHRITLLGSVSRDEYLTAHHEVDVILDTFPFTGGTTTCEALWMGVPTLSLAGSTLIARQGASLLTAAGLCDWVAESKDEYLSKALSFSNDLKELSNLRAGLRAQVLASPLFDAPRFAKNMEKVLWAMWNDSQQADSKQNSLQFESKTVVNNIADDKVELALNLNVEIISATKLSENDFWSKSALGLSLKRHLKQDARLSFKVAFENSRGLSDIFNDCIDQADDDAILAFIHDDVWIDEANFADAVIAGLERFDVIGVAGNRRITPNHSGWAFIGPQLARDEQSNLSGSVAHGKSAFGLVSDFGEVPAECELMDGVFLAAKKSTLKQNNVQFDPQFDFHFYDLDFCRSARKAGLRLGTWLVRMTHQSHGAFGSPHWREKYQLYINKWEATPFKKVIPSLQQELTERELNLQQAMNEVLQIALGYQNSGQIAEAENLYLEILDIHPKHAEANHNLGVIEVHSKGVLAALPRLEMAVQAKPEIEQYWVSYIDGLMQSGAADTAADAIEVGKKYGLRNETAQMLAAEFVKHLESEEACMITTLIPAYKHSYITELLASLSTQTYKKFNVIISDDSPNGEVTKLLSDPALRPLLDKINLKIIQGPRKGVMSNLVHLIDYWNGATPLVHFLNDDDLIYPTFYKTHYLAHTNDNVGVSVSYRWYSNEKGQPFATSIVPNFISDSNNSVDFINAQQLFSSTVPTCNNWLGEMSNAVLTADSVWKFRQSSMQGIPYFGLGDIGIFLQTSCVLNVAIIKNYLGVFRQNPQQNSMNVESQSLKCGFLAWIALALAGFKSGNLSKSQLQQSVDTIKIPLLNLYKNSQDIQEIIHLINNHQAHTAEFEDKFLVLWTCFLAFDDWLFSQRQLSV